MIDTLTSFILENFSIIIKLVFVILCLVCIFVYNWKRRWLYYYASKLPGPFELPLLGSVELAFTRQKGIFKVLEKLVQTYPSVFKCWAGSQLCIFTSKPNDVEILLCSCLEKNNFSIYDYSKENLDTLLTAEVNAWKNRRRIINPTFNQKIINSYTASFVKCAKDLNDELENKCTENFVDVLPIFWKCTVDTVAITLVNIEPKLIMNKRDNFIRNIIRYEQIIFERFFNILYKCNFFWQLSSLNKEIKNITKELLTYTDILLQLHETNLKSSNNESTTEEVKEKNFLTHILNKKMPLDLVKTETLFMFMAGSETAAITMSSVLLLLSIYPDIQEKISEEQNAIFQNFDRDATLEDVNAMHYLERVIKETLRLLPPAPYVARYVDKTTKLDFYTLPAGSALVVPIWNIHRDPEIWPNPSKFDPERFLPEEIEKRPRASYLPFSYGPRNCLGLKFGMMAMKSILSTVLRKFSVKPGKYKSLEEVEMEFHFVGKAKEGYNIFLEKRKTYI